MDGQDGVPTYLMFSSVQIQNGIPKQRFWCGQACTIQWN